MLNMISSTFAKAFDGIKEQGFKLKDTLPDFSKDLNPQTNSIEKANLPINNRTDYSQKYIDEHSPYSKDINKNIRKIEELDLYKNIKLEENKINGKSALQRNIDLDYIDPDTVLSNRERMHKRNAPIDSISGETIDLHHIGQVNDSPLAELTSGEHDRNYGILHERNGESLINRNSFNKERSEYWKERVSIEEIKLKEIKH